MISFRDLAVSLGLIVSLTSQTGYALSQSTERVRVRPGDGVVIVDSKIPGTFELMVFSGRSPRYIAVQNSSSLNVMVTVQCGLSRFVFSLTQDRTEFIRVPSGVQFCVVTVTANNGSTRR